MKTLTGTKGTATLLLISWCLAVGLFGHVTPAESQEVQDLIAEMYSNPWRGPERRSVSPTVWNFNLTSPMTRLLEIGAVAQENLLNKLSEQQIKDQVIFLLGGIGNEDVVGPIIDAMIDRGAMAETPNAARINLSANLALTNLTVADVIWPYGGGTVFERCTDNPKSCWQKWWQDNRDTFSVRVVRRDRNYGNYPNYGAYRQVTAR